MGTRREITPVDSGYAWMVLVACSVVYVMLAGNAKAYGILYTELLHKYDIGAGNTAWIGGIQFFLYFATGALANHLAEKFSFRLVIMTGGVLMSAGYMLSACVPNIEWMYLTMGVISGIGSGLVYSPTATLISFYFAKRRALANGMMVSGSGVGSFVYPYFYRYVIDEFSLQGALLIIGAVILHVCVAGALLRQPYQLMKRTGYSDKDTQLQAEIGGKVLQKMPMHLKSKTTPLVDFSLLQIPRLAMYVTALTINICAFMASFPVFAAHMYSIGLRGNEIAIALSMIGVTEIFARPFFGWLADLQVLQTKTILIFAAAASGTSAMLIPLFRNFPAMVAYGCVMGIFPGAFWGLSAVVMLDCIPLERLTSAMGLLAMFWSLGTVISQPLMGWMEDTTGSWDLSFRVMGTCNYIAGVVLLLEPLIERRWCCGTDTKGDHIPTVDPDRLLINERGDHIPTVDQHRLLINERQTETDTDTTKIYNRDYNDIPLSETKPSLESQKQ